MNTLLRLPAVLQATGLSRARLYELIQSGEFPAPMKHSPKVNVWPSKIVEAWVDKFVEAQQAN